VRISHASFSIVVFLLSQCYDDLFFLSFYYYITTIVTTTTTTNTNTGGRTYIQLRYCQHKSINFKSVQTVAKILRIQSSPHCSMSAFNAVNG
jgi:hypothetical protein